eukprot:395526-Amphidinium_carterae.1
MSIVAKLIDKTGGVHKGATEVVAPVSAEDHCEGEQCSPDVRGDDSNHPPNPAGSSGSGQPEA